MWRTLVSKPIAMRLLSATQVPNEYNEDTAFSLEAIACKNGLAVTLSAHSGEIWHTVIIMAGV